jgi:transcriptional regulator with XRE-family HTH domain
MMKDMRADEVLRKARREAGWTQVEVARAADVPASVVSAIESGSRDPSSRTLERLLAPMGFELSFARRSEGAGLRGAEFVEALRLAETLPHRPKGRLAYPKLRG